MDEVNKQLEIFPYPIPKLISDTAICHNCSIELDAGNEFDTYLWNDGSSNRFLNISGAGIYTVEVSKNSCSISDTTRVYEVEAWVYLPNAFTPNGDGLNDEFKVSDPTNIIDFSMLIYNRRGEVVYQTSDMFEGWDGKHLGQPAYHETYIWDVSYTYYNEFDILIAVSKRGFVTLIR